MPHAVSFALYKAELANPTPEEKRHERSTEAFEMGGYYRMHTHAKTKPDYPVMIWTEPDEAKNPTGATVFQVGNEVLNTVDNADRWGRFVGDASNTGIGWLRCIAVTREAYAKAIETGRWPDDNKPARKMTPEEILGIHIPSGDNEKGAADIIYAEQIADLSAKLDAAIINDQDSADDAQFMLDAMTRLLKLSDDARVEEKAPYLQTTRDIDARWKQVRDPGDTAKKKAETRRDKWIREETKRRQTAAEEINRATREAAEKQGDAIGMPVPTPPEVIPDRVMVSAPTGRGVSAKAIEVVVIVDIAKMVNAMLFMGQPDAELVAYLQTRAEKAKKGKIILPGVQVMTEDEHEKWKADQAKETTNG